MTTVVTGASGHVGGNLVRELCARGRKVRAMVHTEARALEGLDVEIVKGDVRDVGSLRRVFAGADRVFHLAALISIGGDRGGLVPATNVGGARNVATAAHDCGVERLVHFSSIHAFHIAAHGRAVDETRPRADTPAHGAYDRSKAAGEAAVREVIGRGLDAVIVNPTAVLGRHDYGPSRMGRVLLDLYHRRLPSLVDGGFNWVDVRDVVAGALAAEEKGRTGESYILSGNWCSLADLAAMVEEVTGKRPPRINSPMWLARTGAPFIELFGRLTGKEALYTAESLAALRANRSVSHEKATRELGYRPRPTAETVADTYQWLAEAGLIPAGAIRRPAAAAKPGAETTVRPAP